MSFKKLSDSTLLHMTKPELLHNLRIAEYNRETAEQYLNQQAENVKNWEPVIRCRECENYHADVQWCDIHSHFTKPNGEFCHQYESTDWKTFSGDYYCADGKKKIYEHVR